MFISITKQYNAPIERVFAVFSDLEHAADNIEAIKNIDVLTDGPVGKGTRVCETRIMFKREATEVLEVTEWDPPHKYVVEAKSCGCHYTSVFTFQSNGDGTIVETTFKSVPLVFPAKVMSFLLGWMMAGSIRKMFDKDLEDLKVVIEERAETVTQLA